MTIIQFEKKPCSTSLTQLITAGQLLLTVIVNLFTIEIFRLTKETIAIHKYWCKFPIALTFEWLDSNYSRKLNEKSHTRPMFLTGLWRFLSTMRHLVP